MSSASSAAAAARARDRDRVVDLGQAVGEDGLDHDALDLLDPPDVARLVAAGVLWRVGGGGGVHCVWILLFLEVFDGSTSAAA